MQPDTYEYIRNGNHFVYEFFSEGSKGGIKKIVRFALRFSYGTPFYNLALGDLLQVTGGINDSIVSNNGDTLKILATVAAIVIDFTNYFPDALVYFEGSTRGRNRMFQMVINRFMREIDPLFEVFGLKDDGEWEPFQKNRNYNGFLAKRKI